MKIIEIMYNPSVEQGKDAYNEWVILQNTLDVAVSVGGWILGGDRIIGDSEHGNGSTIIPPHGYAIVTDLNTRVYEHFMVKSEFVRLQVDDNAITPYGLNNRGDTIVLEDPNGKVVDEVEYSSSLGGNGNGKTIVKENGTWVESENVAGSLWSPGKVVIKSKVYFWESDGRRYHVPYYSITFVVNEEGHNWDVYTLVKEKGDEWFDEGSRHLVYGNQETQYPAGKKYTFRHVETTYAQGDIDSVEHWPSSWVNDTYEHYGYTVNPYREHVIKVYAINVSSKENYTSLIDADPLNMDSDNDGLSDVEETTYYNRWYIILDYQNPDSDGDGFLDGNEIRKGTNPVSAYSHPGYLFMFYMAGDADVGFGGSQDLGSFIDGYINKLENVENLGKTVNVVIEADYGGDSDTKRYVIKSGEKEEVNMGVNEIDTGDPSYLSDFIIWAINNYGTTHNILVVWGHGNAWKEFLPDMHPIDDLSLLEFSNALKDAENATQTKLDAIIFHACLMSNIAVAYQIRNLANVMIASADTIVAGENYWPYPLMISKLMEHIGTSGGKYRDYSIYSFARWVAIPVFKSTFEDDDYRTFMAIDLHNLSTNSPFFEYLRDSINWLNEHFDSVMGLIKDVLNNIVYYGRIYGINTQIDRFYYDLADFAYYLAEDNSMSIPYNIKYNLSAIGNLIYFSKHNAYASYADYSLNISADFGGGQRAFEHLKIYDVYGLTIYILDYDESSGEYYLDHAFLNKYTYLDFVKDTKWLDLLQKIDECM